MKRFTAEFGKESGGSTSLWSPGKLVRLPEMSYAPGAASDKQIGWQILPLGELG